MPKKNETPQCCFFFLSPSGEEGTRQPLYGGADRHLLSPLSEQANESTVNATRFNRKSDHIEVRGKALPGRPAC